MSWMMWQRIPCSCSITCFALFGMAYDVFSDMFVVAFSGESFVWLMSRKVRNRFTRSLNGNVGRGGKGQNQGAGRTPGKGGDKSKGKGGSKSLQQVPENVNMMDTLASSSDVASAVRQALPDAAILRAQSILVQSDWDVPVCTHQTLSSRGGVAAVPREFVADVIRRIGFTASPVAVVISQEPDEIGLRGYPRQKVKCGLSVMGSDGTRTDVQVDRFLVQCGFGP